MRKKKVGGFQKTKEQRQKIVYYQFFLQWVFQMKNKLAPSLATKIQNPHFACQLFVGCCAMDINYDFFTGIRPERLQSL